MTLDLDALELLLGKATPRPWRTIETDAEQENGVAPACLSDEHPADDPERRCLYDCCPPDFTPEMGIAQGDADLIVAAVNALPDLLRIARAAQELVEKSWLYGQHDKPPRPSEGLSVVKTYRINKVRAALSGETAGETTTDG